MLGLPVPSPFWGDGWPSRPDPDRPWDESAERRRRHEEVLRRWRPSADEAPPEPG